MLGSDLVNDVVYTSHDSPRQRSTTALSDDSALGPSPDRVRGVSSACRCPSGGRAREIATVGRTAAAARAQWAAGDTVIFKQVASAWSEVGALPEKSLLRSTGPAPHGQVQAVRESPR